MKREGRLQSARKWMEEYNGKNIVNGYAKWYGTSKLQAVAELKMLGIYIDEDRINRLKKVEEEKIKRNRIKKEKREMEELARQLELRSEFECYDDEYMYEYDFKGELEEEFIGEILEEFLEELEGQFEEEFIEEFVKEFVKKFMKD